MFSCFCSCCALCGPRLINGWMLLSGSLHVQAPTSNIESLPPTRSLRHNRPSISPNIFIWIEIPFLIIGFHNYEVKQTEHILFISQAPAVMSSKSLDFFFHPSGACLFFEIPLGWTSVYVTQSFISDTVCRAESGFAAHAVTSFALYLWIRAQLTYSSVITHELSTMRPGTLPEQAEAATCPTRNRTLQSVPESEQTKELVE